MTCYNWSDNHHHWSWMERSIESADRFYQYDQHLSLLDRERLADFFQQRKSLAPIFGISAAVGLSLLPRAFRHRSVMFARHAAGRFPLRRGFLLGRIFLAFVGYHIGQKAGDAALRSYQRDQLWGHEAAAGAYSVLSHYPPEIGLRYFRSTARNPHMMMTDPRRSEQAREPPFPVNLMHGWGHEAMHSDRHWGHSRWGTRCHHSEREEYHRPQQLQNNEPLNVSLPAVTPTEPPAPRSYGMWSSQKNE